jgi:hypothetical protein
MAGAASRPAPGPCWGGGRGSGGRGSRAWLRSGRPCHAGIDSGRAPPPKSPSGSPVGRRPHRNRQGSALFGPRLAVHGHVLQLADDPGHEVRRHAGRRLVDVCHEVRGAKRRAPGVAQRRRLRGAPARLEKVRKERAAAAAAADAAGDRHV